MSFGFEFQVRLETRTAGVIDVFGCTKSDSVDGRFFLFFRVLPRGSPNCCCEGFFVL